MAKTPRTEAFISRAFNLILRYSSFLVLMMAGAGAILLLARSTMGSSEIANAYRELPALFLLLNGIVLFATAQRAQNPGPAKTSLVINLTWLIFVAGPLIGFGVISAIFAGKALFFLNAAKAWLLLLAIPAISSLTLGYQEFFGDDDKTADPEIAPESPLESGPPPRSVVWSILKDYAVTGLFVSSYIVGMLLVFGIGSLTYSSLDILLFQNTPVGFDTVQRAAPEFWKSILPRLIAIFLVLGILYGGLGAFSAVAYLLSARKGNTPERALSKAELNFVEDSYLSLSRYIDATEDPRRYGLLYFGAGIVVLFGFMALVAGGSALISSHITSAREAAFALEGNVLHFTGNYYTGALLGLFSGIMLPWATYQCLGTIWPSFGNYMHKNGWNSVNSASRTQGAYRALLTDAVRHRTLPTNRPFEPHGFLQSTFRQYEKSVYWVAASLLAITAVLTYFDSRAYQTVLPDRIEYSSYFSGRTHVASFAQVEEVELACYAYREDGDTVLSLSYTLVLPGGHTLALLDTNVSDKELFTAARINAKLRPHEIPRRRRLEHGLPFLKNDSFVANCEELVLGKYIGTKGPALLNLLGLID